MKKSILFGALAIFAISAMSIQSVEAQEPVKKQDAKTVVKQEQKAADAATTTAAPAPIKIDKKAASDDCCSKKENKACKNKLGTSTNHGKKAKMKPQAKKGHEKVSKTKKVDK